MITQIIKSNIKFCKETAQENPILTKVNDINLNIDIQASSNDNTMQNIEKIFLNFLLSARNEESKKQELTMIFNFSMSAALAAITQMGKVEANLKELSLYLSIPEDDAALLLANNQILTAEILSNLLFPYNLLYQFKQYSNDFNPLSILSESFLKATLLSIISTEKLLASIHKYNQSLIEAAINEQPIDLSKYSISNLFNKIGIILLDNDLDLLIRRLKIV